MADVGTDLRSTPELRVRLIGPFEIAARDAMSLPVGKATTIARQPAPPVLGPERIVDRSYSVPAQRARAARNTIPRCAKSRRG